MSRRASTMLEGCSALNSASDALRERAVADQRAPRTTIDWRRTARARREPGLCDVRHVNALAPRLAPRQTAVEDALFPVIVEHRA